MASPFRGQLVTDAADRPDRDESETRRRVRPPSGDGGDSGSLGRGGCQFAVWRLVLNLEFGGLPCGWNRVVESIDFEVGALGFQPQLHTY